MFKSHLSLRIVEDNMVLYYLIKPTRTQHVSILRPKVAKIGAISGEGVLSG